MRQVLRMYYLRKEVFIVFGSCYRECCLLICPKSFWRMASMPGLRPVSVAMFALSIIFLLSHALSLGKYSACHPAAESESRGSKAGDLRNEPYEFLLALTVNGTRYDKEFKRTVLQILRFCIPNIDSATVDYDNELGEIVARSYAYKGQGPPRACQLNVLASDEAAVDVLGIFSSFVDRKLLVPVAEHISGEALKCSQQTPSGPTGLGNPFTITSCQFQSMFNLNVYPVNPLLEHQAMDGIAKATGCANAKCLAWLSRLLLAEYLPRSIPRVMLLDLDILVLENLEELFDYFAYMPKGAVVGLAYDFQPGLMDNAWTAPSRDRFNLGYGPYIGFPGFNGGVALYDLEEMRTSETYRQLMLDSDSLWKIREEYTDTESPMYYGDQDVLTMIYFQHPELFYILPCGWNYQLCTGGFVRAMEAGRPFDFWCHEEPKIYHANCQSGFPHGNNGIFVEIKNGGYLGFQDAPIRHSMPRSVHHHARQILGGKVLA